MCICVDMNKGYAHGDCCAAMRVCMCMHNAREHVNC
jgi:hypothetical protein